jgi:hypothetical protein
MKPSRLIPVLAALMLLTGWLVWAFSTDQLLRQLSAWLWLSALVIMSTPLLIWTAYAVLRKLKNRDR